MIADANSIASHLSRRTALVTGASRGLGAAFALNLARAGVRVVLVARSREPLEAVVRGIRAAGGKAWAIVADVADKRAIHRVTAEAAAVAGPIDLLVHNAATLGAVPLRPLAETDCEVLELALALTLVVPFPLTNALLASTALRP